ncbi:hypothetical protein BD779DRAFT_1581520 [Infundibulicybe gibba]|nr:hypothetical protein BD779DRAFT_1581520 [Infundibulicybe gibba]
MDFFFRQDGKVIVLQPTCGPKMHTPTHAIHIWIAPLVPAVPVTKYPWFAKQGAHRLHFSPTRRPMSFALGYRIPHLLYRKQTADTEIKTITAAIQVAKHPRSSHHPPRRPRARGDRHAAKPYYAVFNQGMGARPTVVCSDRTCIRASGELYSNEETYSRTDNTELKYQSQENILAHAGLRRLSRHATNK